MPVPASRSGSPPLALLVAMCSSLTACWFETPDSSYSTAQEVFDSGYLEKGWIPRWLPGDATDIRETHNIDSNIHELSFAIPGRESLALPAACVSIGYKDTRPAQIRRRWWPSEQELETGYDFFRCPAGYPGSGFVGVNSSGKRVVHWDPHAR